VTPERRSRCEQGSALVIALVFITVIAVMLAALLSLTDTSFRAVRAAREQRLDVYSADGAVDASISAFPFSSISATIGGQDRCEAWSDGTVGPTGLPARTVTVNERDVVIECREEETP
jgi:hypothetical protein